jgi:hypothetical protein
VFRLSLIEGKNKCRKEEDECSSMRFEDKLLITIGSLEREAA